MSVAWPTPQAEETAYLALFDSISLPDVMNPYSTLQSNTAINPLTNSSLFDVRLLIDRTPLSIEDESERSMTLKNFSFFSRPIPRRSTLAILQHTSIESPSEETS